METFELALTVLDEDESLRRLAAQHLGRLAVVVDGQPLVFPVNYAVHGRDIVFRTGPGTKLLGAAGHRVAFEIDGCDNMYHDGWSVMVVGRAFQERDQARLHELDLLPLTPWCPGAKGHWMRIRTAAITGRRIGRFPTVVRGDRDDR